MTFKPLKSFDRDFERLPARLRAATLAALERLIANPGHPSLRLKKMQGQEGIWELRVTQGYRVTFQVEGEYYVLRRVGPHDILQHP